MAGLGPAVQLYVQPLHGVATRAADFTRLTPPQEWVQTAMRMHGELGSTRPDAAQLAELGLM